MADKPKHLPPDAPLLELAKAVNIVLRPEAGITVYRIEQAGGALLNAMIYEYGSRRAIVRTQNMLTAHDAPDIIKAVREWIAKARPINRWTTDPDEAGIRL